MTRHCYATGQTVWHGTVVMGQRSKAGICLLRVLFMSCQRTLLGFAEAPISLPHAVELLRSITITLEFT